MNITNDVTGWERPCLVFVGRDIVLREDGSLPSPAETVVLRQHISCGEVVIEEQYGICAMKILEETALPEGYKRMQLRLYNDVQTEEVVLRLSRAKALVEWVDNTRFCTRCGKPLHAHKEMTALQCEGCGKTVFPRIEPCIIVLVRRGKQMLLARHVQRNQDIYACIAGFMEVGETVEQCVKREIMEETGIGVKNVQYFGSQSWPFPSQLMLAFTADYESGELAIQEDEIADAGWFDEDNCPATPQPGSIAYRLIHNIR